MTASIAPARLAATVLLIKDTSQGLKVLMVERHHQIDFVPGALVFPGGRIDAHDRDPALFERCIGGDRLKPEELAQRVGAIRETFEESGVLLAYPRGSRAIVDNTHLEQISLKYRTALHDGKIQLRHIVETEDLELGCDLLVPFSHWVTPEPLPKRYDTFFYLARAPADHIARHDGLESVDSLWLTPEEAISACDTRSKTIIFPTRLNLLMLAESSSVDQSLEAARNRTLKTIMPDMVETPEGVVFRIPEDSGYAETEGPMDPIAEKPQTSRTQ